MTTTRRTLTAAAVITAATLALGACGSSKPAEPAASPSSAATTAEPTPAPSATASSVPTVPGYRPGEIPPVPA
ncbi:MAG: OmpA family protein, partial [Pauljensenia sp.]|nr:OmpA family protein [Pauljensenia sp.]